MVPAPTRWPKLVVASNSGNPNPSNPDIGNDGPKPLTLIAYLPILMHKRLQVVIIAAIFNDHEGVSEKFAIKNVIVSVVAKIIDCIKKSFY